MKTDTPRTDKAEKQINFAVSVPANRYCEMICHARTLERENIELRRALEPFAVWVEKHGAVNSIGRNCAIITAGEWNDAWKVVR